MDLKTMALAVKGFLENMESAKNTELQRRQNPPSLTDYLIGAFNNYSQGMKDPMFALNYMPMGMTIKAFHGSPYKFKKFSNENIGTGEGAQAFGYGHYMTESPDIAKQYTMQSNPRKLMRDIDEYKQYITERQNNILNIKKELEMNKGKLESGDLLPAFKNNRLRSIAEEEKMISVLERNIKDAENMMPKVYETRLFPGKKPSEYALLEWDKPVSEIVEKKIYSTITNEIDTLRKQGKMFDSGRIKALDLLESYMKHSKSPNTGKAIYEQLVNPLGEKEASSFLSKAGIGGIKYPSGTLSGMKDSPLSNYVIFNPEDIKIKKTRQVK